GGQDLDRPGSGPVRERPEHQGPERHALGSSGPGRGPRPDARAGAGALMGGQSAVGSRRVPTEWALAVRERLWAMPRGGIVPVLAPVRGGAAASIFDPLTLTNLSLWLKGDAGTYQDSGFVTPATADGDPVGGWQDQSGNVRHFAQATAANR